jgi:hypothetical protein
MTVGQTIRDAQLNLFEQRDVTFLARARALAVQICQTQGSVSINDIRQNLALPAEMHPSVLGAVFKGKQFKAVGFTEATHPQAHARIIRIYQLKESFNGQQSHA